MADILAKARAGRTVLKRTTQAQGFKLPSLVLYMEWLAGENKRRVIDTDGQEHRLPDKIVESSYRLVTGGQAEELLGQYWPAQLGDEAPAKEAKAKPAPAKAEAKPVAAKPAAAKPAAAKPAAKGAAKSDPKAKPTPAKRAR